MKASLPVTSAAATQQPKDFQFVVDACTAIRRCVGVVSRVPDVGLIVRGTRRIVLDYVGNNGSLFVDPKYLPRNGFRTVVEW